MEVSKNHPTGKIWVPVTAGYLLEIQQLAEHNRRQNVLQKGASA